MFGEMKTQPGQKTIFYFANSIPFRSSRALGVILLVFSFVLLPAAATTPLVIDDFAYPTSASARQAWINSYAPPVVMEETGDWGTTRAMVLPCDFATRSSRCYWDRTVSLDLASYTEFELEVFAPNPELISAFTLYFRSGTGWYGASAPLTRAGWQTLRFAVTDFIP
jgi:hypothetical protein